ncbi:hypothetical protein BOX15_Mlig032611g1, partial [Macrostomum lignano]
LKTSATVWCWPTCTAPLSCANGPASSFWPTPPGSPSPGWDQMVRRQPHLVAEAFKALAAQAAPPMGPTPKKRMKLPAS